MVPHPFAFSPSSPTLAKINGEKISAAEFQKYLRLEEWKFGGRTSKHNILDNFLKEKLLLQEAEKMGIRAQTGAAEESLTAFKNQYAKGEEFEKLLKAKGWSPGDFKERRARELQIQKLVETVAQKNLRIDEEELKKYYETHVEEFRRPEEVHARQIVTDSKERAEALRETLLKGTPFEEIALQYSISPDRKAGGDLGWFERGVMPKEFDQVCFHLKEGDLSPVVSTPYGFHLFQLLARRQAGVAAFEEVKEEIGKKIVAEKGREIFGRWYEELRKKTEVKVYAEVLNEIR